MYSSSTSLFPSMVAHIPGFLFFFFFFTYNGASGSSITIINDCGFTVWPGISGSLDVNMTGFELKKGTSRSFQAPGNNWSGHIWGRTGCDFNKSGSWSCATGDCGTGEMECKGRNFTQPVTLAELYRTTGVASYDVSLLSGFNLPMTIEVKGTENSCPVTGCATELNRQCPKDLKLEGGGGCKSACQVYPTEDYCCTFLCIPTSHGKFFSTACPKAITYESTSPKYPDQCPGDDYTVRFCPRADIFSSIKLGDQLNSYDTLVSKNGNANLGFFGFTGGKLSIRYWDGYTNWYVWVANLYTVVMPPFFYQALSIDPNTGNLIITAGGKIITNITDIDVGPNPNVTAALEDNGNFRLINEMDKSVLWQSFDHPHGVLMPGMKLGYDLITGKNWILTSWMSNGNPDLGAFTLSWEAPEEASQRLVIRRRGQPYWTSGNLKNQIFEYIRQLEAYKINSTYNNKQRYVSYDLDQEYINLEGNPLRAPWVLTSEGRIEVGHSNFLTPEFCYGIETHMGCMKGSGLPECRTENDNFSKQNGEFVDDVTTSVTDRNLSLGISDCFVKCWNSCSCVGFNSSNDNGTGCVFWNGMKRFTPNPHENSTLIYVISSQNQIKNQTQNQIKNQTQNQINPSIGNKPTNDMKLIWILIGTCIPLVILCLGLLWCRKKRMHRQEVERRKRDEYSLELTASESFEDVHRIESNGGKGNNLIVFSIASIMAATNDFSVENKLGEGGFGPVYKGKLSDGREVAIKRLSRTSGQGLVEFKNELVLIAKLQHTHLVRVLGCCIHGVEKMLVYEYMPNKSLDFFLFDENRKGELDWAARFNIIEGIAQGLLYLHKYSRMRVIHRDLKASNILLDESMNPKISDFGMARIFNPNETQAMTKRVVGTFGYMPPEYLIGGTFSVKSDIYSFGVLVLEIISGKKNSSFSHLDPTSSLIGYAWKLWKQGDALELMDPSLASTCVVQQLLRTVHVALLCVQNRATDRPTASDMISMLLNDTILLPNPNKPPFVTRRVNSDSTSSECNTKNCSLNNMTVTIMEAR